MKKLLLLSLCVSFSSPAFAASDKTPEQYWADTGFTLGVLSSRLGIFSRENCYHSLPEFRGCVAALNAVGAHHEPAVKFVPSSLLNDASVKLGAKQDEFDGLTEVAVLEAPESESLRVTWTRELDTRKKIDADLEVLYNLGALAPVNFQKAFDTIREQSVKDETQGPLVAGESMSAFLSEALDAHARIEPTKQDEDEVADADQSFAGIGVPMQELKGRKILGVPMEGTPAEKAGLKEKDELLSVNDQSVVSLKVDDVVKKIRGPENTSVKLRVKRGDKELDFTVVRAKIVQENLESRVVNDLGRKVGVIRLRSFMDDKACATMDEKIHGLVKEKVQGLVLDLRGNGGGILDQAVCIGGLFSGKKVIVRMKSLTDGSVTQGISHQAAITELPLVVLVDAGSASASEIVAGAMQDYQRAWIVGERSFGKGSVQASQRFLGNEDITLWRTVQRFYQPNGRTNQIVGIQPDFVRPIKPDASEDDRFALRERDYFPTAMDALSDPWTETRPAAVAKIEACAAQGKLASAAYEKEKAAGKTNSDFQLFSAEEVLSCAK